MSVKSCRLVEPVNLFVLAAGEQHDLVAPPGPGMIERMLQNRSPESSSPECWGCHDILDESIGTAGSRHVWDHAQRASGDESVVNKCPEVLQVWVLLDPAPDLVDYTLSGQRIVRRMKMLIEPKQIAQIGFS